MKLSALDIRKQEFSRTLRGYDPDEVDSFIEVISDQWKEMVDELKRDNDRISELELKLEHYHKVEEALEEALQTARTSARQTIVQADVKAKKIIEAAEEDAEKITRDARDHRRDIKREAAKFSVRRKEIVAKLRAFLLSEMEMLAHYDDDDPTGFIKLLGEAAGQQKDGQPQLTAGSPVSDALEDQQQQPERARQVSTDAVSDNQASQESPAREQELTHDGAAEHEQASELDPMQAELDQRVEPRASREDVSRTTRPSNQPHAGAADPAPNAESTADQTMNQASGDEPASNGPDTNDSFHSEYERMATIQEIYGQFDPDAADDVSETAASDAAANHHADADYADESYADGEYADESYADGDYASGTYSDESYAEDDYSADYYANDDYPNDSTGDGYADPGQGTAAQGREYPKQSRPAQDRPPADSPAASGQRAPGMNRPDAHQELSESATEDIEKIRRILEDLDN